MLMTVAFKVLIAAEASAGNEDKCRLLCVETRQKGQRKRHCCCFLSLASSARPYWRSNTLSLLNTFIPIGHSHYHFPSVLSQFVFAVLIPPQTLESVPLHFVHTVSFHVHLAHYIYTTVCTLHPTPCVLCLQL